MSDQSHLDAMYFVDEHVYNCPFCNRRNVEYMIYNNVHFQWSSEKPCSAIFVTCKSCENRSMHLTYNLEAVARDENGQRKFVGPNVDIILFYSVPTSFFTVDQRIPKVVRELISEAEGCRKMNYLTGASACVRKAIYELLENEKVPGEHYDERIKALKGSHPEVDADLFDLLGAIQQMTSDKLHEDSWDEWDGQRLNLITETLKIVLHELYVIPATKAERSKAIKDLQAEIESKP